MADYLRLLTVTDHEIPLAALQRAVTAGAVWSVDHPGTLGNYLALGPAGGTRETIWATVERNPVGPDTLGAEEVAEYIDRLETGGPPSASRWLADYLESVRAIYAIRIYPEVIGDDPDAIETVDAVRTALREAVGGIGQWDGNGFTNEADCLIWCDPADHPVGVARVAILDESTGQWIPFDLDFGDAEGLAAFLRGERPRAAR
jgi:hypothetical protein